MNTEKTVQEVVECLNWKLWGEKGEENCYASFIYQDATVWKSIKYYDSNTGMEVILWDSEQDGREYREETDDYEPLEDHVLKEFNKLAGSLFKIDNYLNNKEIE